MKDEFDKEFDRYMEGNSEISRLYSQSKKNSVSENIADVIRKSAKSPPVVSEISRRKSSVSKRYFLPVAIAASILLSFVIFKGFVFVDKKEDAEIVALKTDPVIDITPEILPNNETTEQEEAEKIDNLLAQEFSDESNYLEKNNSRPESQLAKINDEETSTPSEEINREPAGKQNAVMIAQKEASGTDTKSTSTSPASKDVAKTVSEETGTERKTHIAKTEVMEQPVETVENEDTDFSMDWMNRLSANAPTGTQVTKQVSSTLSEKAWIKKILQLHENNRYDEAAKNIREFRKLYPRYKLPEVLRNAYENR